MQRLAVNWFFVIFSESEHLMAYIATQLLYKCGHCSKFGVKEKYLHSSGAKIGLQLMCQKGGAKSA